jgi:ABC-type transport system involved in multi-copper enzyme maturation permease subunit
VPILDQGYQPYRGTLRRSRLRFLHFTLAALRRNNRWWVWALLIVGLLFGSGKEYIFVFITYVPEALFGAKPNSDFNVVKALAEHPRFYTDMMSTQAFWALVLGVTVGAGEIAEDLRTGALTFYLGRPVTRLDYVLGKVAAVSFVVILVTLAPLLFLFVVQALFEGSWKWLGDHAKALPSALAFTAVLCTFVSGLVLGMSAVARRRLWATVSIAGALIALTVTSWVLAPANSWTAQSEEQAFHRQVEEADTPEERRALNERYADAFDDLGSRSDTGGWKVLSPLASLAASARDLFGNPLPTNFSHGRHWGFVLGIPLLFFGLLWRRVRAVEVVT